MRGMRRAVLIVLSLVLAAQAPAPTPQQQLIEQAKAFYRKAAATTAHNPVGAFVRPHAAKVLKEKGR